MDFSQLPWPDTIALHLRGLLVTSRYFQDTTTHSPDKGEKILIVLPQWTLFLICWPPQKPQKCRFFLPQQRSGIFKTSQPRLLTRVHSCTHMWKLWNWRNTFGCIALACDALLCFQLFSVVCIHSMVGILVTLWSQSVKPRKRKKWFFPQQHGGLDLLTQKKLQKCWQTFAPAETGRGQGFYAELLSGFLYLNLI